MSRILKFAGNTVIKCCYPGDIGAHVAKWIWYYLNFYPEKGNFPSKNFTKWVGELYTLATKKVEENPDQYKAEIGALQKKLEDGDPELQKIWKETRELCLIDMKKIFAELGSGDIDKRYFESEVEQPGIQIVQQMLADGIAQYSEGAVAINLEEWKLGRFLLLKSTGASLYSTKDIALAYRKREEYPHYDISLYVVGSEQEHHFQQLFKTLELIGFDFDKLHHLSYGLLDLKDGKMSSRAGNVILYEDFRDQLLEQAEALMADREIPAEQKKQTARAVAFGSLKFWILLQDSEKKILFDPEQALSFEGETGPYLQYTYARISSILRKAQQEMLPPEKGEGAKRKGVSMRGLLNTPADKSLLLQLSKFSEEVQKSASSYKPNYIARFCLDTAQLFNSYYHNHKIIDETNPDLSQARLLLIQSVQQVLKNGLELLGIDTVESM
jgi:arginyl-tRNA synthetase